MTRVRQPLFTLLVALAGLTMLADGGAAADDTRITGSFSFVDSFTCAAPILIDGSYDEVMHTYDDEFGNAVRLAFTGKVIITYTNLNTGDIYSPNSSGPSTVNLLTGQSILRGGNGALFDTSGVLIATDGRVVLDEYGHLVSLTGHEVDVCARLGTFSK